MSSIPKTPEKLREHAGVFSQMAAEGHEKIKAERAREIKDNVPEGERIDRLITVAGEKAASIEASAANRGELIEDVHSQLEAIEARIEGSDHFLIERITVVQRLARYLDDAEAKKQPVDLTKLQLTDFTDDVTLREAAVKDGDVWETIKREAEAARKISHNLAKPNATLATAAKDAKTPEEKSGLDWAITKAKENPELVITAIAGIAALVWWLRSDDGNDTSTNTNKGMGIGTKLAIAAGGVIGITGLVMWGKDYLAEHGGDLATKAIASATGISKETVEGAKKRISGAIETGKGYYREVSAFVDRLANEGIDLPPIDDPKIAASLGVDPKAKFKIPALQSMFGGDLNKDRAEDLVEREGGIDAARAKLVKDGFLEEHETALGVGSIVLLLWLVRGGGIATIGRALTSDIVGKGLAIASLVGILLACGVTPAKAEEKVREFADAHGKEITGGMKYVAGQGLVAIAHATGTDTTAIAGGVTKIRETIGALKKKVHERRADPAKVDKADTLLAELDKTPASDEGKRHELLTRIEALQAEIEKEIGEKPAGNVGTFDSIIFDELKVYRNRLASGLLATISSEKANQLIGKMERGEELTNQERATAIWAVISIGIGTAVIKGTAGGLYFGTRFIGEMAGDTLTWLHRITTSDGTVEHSSNTWWEYGKNAILVGSFGAVPNLIRRDFAGVARWGMRGAIWPIYSAQLGVRMVSTGAWAARGLAHPAHQLTKTAAPMGKIRTALVGTLEVTDAALKVVDKFGKLIAETPIIERYIASHVSTTEAGKHKMDAKKIGETHWREASDAYTEFKNTAVGKQIDKLAMTIAAKTAAPMSHIIPAIETLVRVAGPAMTVTMLLHIANSKEPAKAAAEMAWYWGAFKLGLKTAKSMPGHPAIKLLGGVVAGVGAAFAGQTAIDAAYDSVAQKITEAIDASGTSMLAHAVGSAASDVTNLTMLDFITDRTYGEWQKGDNAFDYFSNKTTNVALWLPMGEMFAKDNVNERILHRDASDIAGWNTSIDEKIKDGESELQKKTATYEALQTTQPKDEKKIEASAQEMMQLTMQTAALRDQKIEAGSSWFADQAEILTAEWDRYVELQTKHHDAPTMELISLHESLKNRIETYHTMSSPTLNIWRYIIAAKPALTAVEDARAAMQKAYTPKQMLREKLRATNGDKPAEGNDGARAKAA